MRTQRNLRRTVVTAAPVVVLAVLAGGAALTLLPKDAAEGGKTATKPVAGGNAAGIKVTVNGSSVQATTSACTKGGRASLIGGGGNASFAGGQQATLAGGSATWTNVNPGTYTVAVVCAGGDAAGSQRVTISGNSATSPTSPAGRAPATTPTTAPTGTPTGRPTAPVTTPTYRPQVVPQGRVRAGLGGGAPQHVDTSTQIAGGVALALTAGGAGTFLIRRRNRRAAR